MVTSQTRTALAVTVVAAQAVLLVALFAGPGGDDWTTPRWLRGFASAVEVAGWVVLLVAAVNLGRSLTPLPLPASSGTLKTGGAYRFVRHPIYSAVLGLAFAAAATSGSLVKLVLALALLALFTGKARWEEDLLRERYAGYADYAARTPRFFPRPRRGGQK